MSLRRLSPNACLQTTPDMDLVGEEQRAVEATSPEWWRLRYLPEGFRAWQGLE